MRSILVFLIAIVALSSCKPILIYDLSLSSVNRPKDVTKPFGDKKVVSFENNGQPVYTYEDENISIAWSFMQSYFSFLIKNKTDNSISINWDKMKYVDYRGQAFGIVHKGVAGINSYVSFSTSGDVIFTFKPNKKHNVFQVPTSVPASATYGDYIQPTEIGYNEGGTYQWKEGSFFPQKRAYVKNLEGYKKACENIKVRMSFPITIDGIENEYVFEFQINDVTQGRKNVNY